MSVMGAAEVPKKSKGPIVDPALCRGCRSIKKCRLLTAEYEWMGNKENYSDMFVDVFGLLLSHLDDDDEKTSCICATCVTRLREASAFRSQVLRSEEVFLEARLENKTDCNIEIKVEVKAEEENLCDMSADNVFVPGAPSPEPTDEDDLPILTLIGTANEAPPSAEELVRRKLEDKVLRLQDKLDQMLEKTTVAVERHEVAKPKQIQPKLKVKPPEPEIQQDAMAYSNTVTIVNNSYVCPFHNRISIYYCFYCKDQFTNPTELREHTLQHDPVMLFENTVENKKIPKIDITRIDCRLCDAKIDDLNTFKTHITAVHGIDLFPVTNEFLKFKLTQDNLSCTECDRNFPYFDSLKKHMIEHFGTFICDICGACFLEQNSLRTHIKSHSKVEANFPCEICGKNLKSKYSRYLHIATVHEKKPTVNCYKCDASFLSYALRNRHLIEVHGDKRTFPCKLCDKVYNRRKTLMEHIRRNHQKVMRHQCQLCDQRFYLPSRLKEHMATHTGERSFRCELCDKSYPRLQSLQDHTRTHTSNERRYKCHMCTSAFTQQSNWKNHIKRHHIPYGANANFT